MIPAKITNLDPVQVEFWYPPSFREKLIIADVENVEMAPLQITKIPIWTYTNEICTTRLDLNDSCFIELTGKGKTKIVKL